MVISRTEEPVLALERKVKLFRIHNSNSKNLWDICNKQSCAVLVAMPPYAASNMPSIVMPSPVL